jgi:hypothetical protein
METLTNVRNTRKLVVMLICLLLFPAIGRAHWYIQDTKMVPVDRLIANLEHEILVRTNDVKLLYALARVHSMAYALQTNEVKITKKDGMPFFGYSYPRMLPPLQPGLAGMTNLLAKAHLERAILLYRKSALLKPDDLATELGLAWCLDQSGDKAHAMEGYRKVLALAWKEESSDDFVAFGQTVTEETADYLLPLLDPVKDAEEIKKISRYKTLMKKKGRAWTPILIPLEPSDMDLQSLVNPSAQVAFDADGSGLARKWDWITPKAGWLVYDHEGKGKITSGLQLVGAVTFWIFWENGYQALSALDDNGDGVLTGDELKGLAVWQDKNGNGKSDPGEVVSLSALGITSLSVNYQTHKSGIVFNPQGATFKDGTTRPTYDWIMHSGAK